MKLLLKLKKIRIQIALFYIISTVILVVSVGSYLYIKVSEELLNNNISAVSESLNKSGKYIDMYIDHLIFLADLYAENNQVINYLSSSIAGNKSGDLEKDILYLIHQGISSEENLKSVIIVSKEGEIVSNESDLNMSMSKDMMEQEWYMKAIESGGKPILTSARMQDFSMDKDKWVISLAREIKDTEEKHLGVVLIDVEYKVIDDYLVDLKLSDSGYAYILNSVGDVVYHKDPQYFQDKEKKKELVQTCELEQGYHKEDNRLVYKYMLENADWLLIGVTPLDEIIQLKNQMFRTIIILGALLLIIVIIGSAMIADKITNPIRKLEETMNDLEHGLKEIKIDKKGCYEAKSLSNHFNIMVGRIKVLMDEIKRNERAIRDYELKILHSQINPHFLYNTLDTIVWMAEFNDSEKVIAITKSLADFFRLSLNGGNELTTIVNEINHGKAYLYIQKERYGDQLEYTFEVDDDIKGVEIPKSILQPIIENAIYHGIKGLEKVGVISVTAIKGKDNILFSIEDNGKGFNSSELDNLVKERQVKLGGVGLMNVDQRIKLYYGKEYGVTISSIIDSGTKVTITIPFA